MILIKEPSLGLTMFGTNKITKFGTKKKKTSLGLIKNTFA